MSRVLVGMSGGVDSSVAAAVLASAGHDVVGVSLQLYDHSGGGRASRCCSPEDFLDARRVAAQMGFPYYVVNREEQFGRRVLEYFVDEYRHGRTPNPCVRCNAEVKFEALVRLADWLGADSVATGHYARLEEDAAGGGRRLLRALDREKDQSYFLFGLTQPQLRAARFPLGEMTKTHVRETAARLGLAGAWKPESQDVCFVEGGDYRDFLRSRAREPEPAGQIVDGQGRELGVHAGLSDFTVGQRRGIGVSSSRRLYVLRVDSVTNQVVVGGRDDLLCDRIELSEVRFVRPVAAMTSFEATVRVRYRHEGALATVSPGAGETAVVSFRQPLMGVSPGQAAVFYDDDEVIGGGWIGPGASLEDVAALSESA